MKNIFTIVLFLLTAFAGRAQEKNFIDQPYVEVAGSADTAVTPDEIYLRFSIAEGESGESQMLAALKSLNINANKDLTIGDSHSRWGFYSLKDAPDASRRTFTLKTASPQAAALATEKLQATGISNVSLDRISHSTLESIQNGMRAKAVANAQKRAAALVKGVTQILGPALHIAEVQNEEALKEARIQLAKDQAMPPNTFRKIQVAVTVNVKFLMRYNTY